MCRCLWRRSRKCIWRGGGDDWRRRGGCLGRVQFESRVSEHVLRRAAGRRGRGRGCGRRRRRLAHWSDASRPFLFPDEAKTGEEYCGNGADDGGNDDEDCTIGARACRVARFDEGRLRGRGCGRRRRRGRRRRDGRCRGRIRRGLGSRGHVRRIAPAAVQGPLEGFRGLRGPGGVLGDDRQQHGRVAGHVLLEREG